MSDWKQIGGIEVSRTRTGDVWLRATVTRREFLLKADELQDVAMYLASAASVRKDEREVAA